MKTRGRYARCPNCGAIGATQRDYVRHLLQEAHAAGRGVTTNQFLQWGAGSRFGARIHELRHDEGRTIVETNELYTLLDSVLAGPAAVSHGDLPVAGGTGQDAAATYEPVALFDPTPPRPISPYEEDAA